MSGAEESQHPPKPLFLGSKALYAQFTGKTAGFKYNSQVKFICMSGSHQAAASRSARRKETEGAQVIVSQINHGYMDIGREMLKNGVVGQIDYKIGPSLDDDLLNKQNPNKGSLNNAVEFSQTGGWAVGWCEEFDLVVGGYVSPRSLHIEPIVGPDGEHKSYLKCFTADYYGTIEKDDLPGVYDVLEDRNRGVFINPNDSALRERLIAAINTLRQRGDVKYN
jgi:hypothetical protein